MKGGRSAKRVAELPSGNCWFGSVFVEDSSLTLLVEVLPFSVGEGVELTAVEWGVNPAATGGSSSPAIDEAKSVSMESDLFCWRSFCCSVTCGAGVVGTLWFTSLSAGVVVVADRTSSKIESVSSTLDLTSVVMVSASGDRG